jgi:hypothetical protein
MADGVDGLAEIPEFPMARGVTEIPEIPMARGVTEIPEVAIARGFTELPEEIQAYILTRLDGASMVRAQRVCSLWRRLLHSLERHLHLWLTCCMRELSPDTLVELTGLTQLTRAREATVISTCRQLPWMFWKEVYAEHHRCGLVARGGERHTQLDCSLGCGKITCLALKGKVDNMISLQYYISIK